MSDFRRLSETVLASPQIDISDVAEAKAMGVSLIINNRPDGEDLSAPQGEAIEAAAKKAGLSYVAIPIGHSGFSEPQIEQMTAALATTEGTVLAYCRSGTRSTFLWALAEAKSGKDPQETTEAALAAGYDVRPIRAMMDMLAAR